MDGWPVLGLEPAFPPLFSCCGNGDSLPPPWLGLGLELGLPPDVEGDDDGDDEGDGIEVPGGCGIDGG